MPNTSPARIGSIGSEQGVKASNRPRPKKASRLQTRCPCCRPLAKAWSLACSAAGATLPPRSMLVVCGG